MTSTLLEPEVTTLKASINIAGDLFMQFGGGAYRSGRLITNFIFGVREWLIFTTKSKLNRTTGKSEKVKSM